LSLMLALYTAVARPSVHVDAEAADEALRGWLVVRLSQEGFELVPEAQQAEVDLKLVRDGDEWIVEADATDRQAYRVADGPANLQRLEILHRAVAAAEEVQPRALAPEGSGAIPRVAIDVDPAATAEARDRLAAQVTLAVLAAGARVAAPGTAHDRRVCAAEDDAGVVLGSGEGSCAAAEVVAIAEAPRWIARAVTAPTAAAASEPEPDGAAELAPQPEAKAEPAPETEPAPARAAAARPIRAEPAVPSRATNAAARRPLALRLGARAGIVARTRPVDGAVGADVRIGRAAGPSAWLDVQVWPSREAAGNLAIVETLPAVGLRWRFVVHDRVALDAGALVGVAVHAYRSTTLRGSVADVSGEIAGALGIRLVRTLELQLEARGGLAGRSRAHEIDGRIAWERNAWRISAFAGLSWGFSLGGRR
jgi:hypothetical protein